MPKVTELCRNAATVRFYNLFIHFTNLLSFLTIFKIFKLKVCWTIECIIKTYKHENLKVAGKHFKTAYEWMVFISLDSPLKHPTFLSALSPWQILKNNAQKMYIKVLLLFKTEPNSYMLLHKCYSWTLSKLYFLDYKTEIHRSKVQKPTYLPYHLKCLPSLIKEKQNLKLSSMTVNISII